MKNQTDSTLEPGPYSVFLLKDDGTWTQPTYLVGDGWTEEAFGMTALSREGAFYYCGVSRDEDCPEESLEPFGDFA